MKDEDGPARFGPHYGRACLGCEGTLMLAMFGAGLGRIAWMLGLTGVMLYEVKGRHVRALQCGLAAVFVIWAVLMAAHPPWLPHFLASLT